MYKPFPHDGWSILTTRWQFKVAPGEIISGLSPEELLGKLQLRGIATALDDVDWYEKLFITEYSSSGMKPNTREAIDYVWYAFSKLEKQLGGIDGIRTIDVLIAVALDVEKDFISRPDYGLRMGISLLHRFGFLPYFNDEGDLMVRRKDEPSKRHKPKRARISA